MSSRYENLKTTARRDAERAHHNLIPFYPIEKNRKIQSGISACTKCHASFYVEVLLDGRSEYRPHRTLIEGPPGWCPRDGWRPEEKA